MAVAPVPALRSVTVNVTGTDGDEGLVQEDVVKTTTTASEAATVLVQRVAENVVSITSKPTAVYWIVVAGGPKGSVGATPPFICQIVLEELVANDRDPLVPSACGTAVA